VEADPLNVLWADAVLVEVRASYDSLDLLVRESTGRAVTVTAVGHIGFQLVGLWDETVIESGDLVRAHPFAESCLASVAERAGDPPPASGSPSRDRGRFTTLAISLIDGAVLLVVAAEFQVTAA
jgi:hypothetical protein